MANVKIGNLLTRIKDVVEIEDGKEYKRVTIKTKNQGISLRDIENGVNIGTKKQFRIKKGQFLLSKIDARYGAFGIVPEEVDDAIITGNFWAYEVNHELINIEWLNLFVKSPNFIAICDDASSGTTNRRYLNEEKFLNYSLSLPSIEEQNYSVQRYYTLNHKYSSLVAELQYQQELSNIIRQSILQEAVQGRLVSQDPNDEPASVLLQKIAQEKELLIKEMKIKKEKPLPLINKDEIPYELPTGWEWVRLRDVCYKITDGTHQTPRYTDDGAIFLSAQNVKPFRFMPRNHRFVSYEDYETYIKQTKPELDDVLLTRVGSNIGESAVIDQNLDFAFYVSLCLIKPCKEFVNPRYICLWLNSPEGTKKSLSNVLGKGTSQGNLNLALINNFVISLPPLSEQKRIVEKVDQLMALCDELERNTDQSKRDTELLMQSVLQKNLQ